MSTLKPLLENNKQWAKEITQNEPEFFVNLAKGQSPKYLWIGCADSRVPANQLLGLRPGEIFVHRNIANVVVHTDLNLLSVLQYAVDVLKVEQIIVCGHSGCGGVMTAVDKTSAGLVDNWLRHIQDVEIKHQTLIDSLTKNDTSKDNKYNIMCKLNVIEQAINVTRTTIVQDAWKRNQKLAIHGVVYHMADGLLQQLSPGIESNNDIKQFYKKGIDLLKINRS